MDDNKQILITVKKADGTAERITLDELKKRREAKSGGEPTVVRVVQPVKIIKPVEEIAEPIAESKFATTVVVPTRLDQVSKIISGFSFKIPVQFENRLRSAIQLRIKDIRSHADTLDVCVRSIKDGGLGLTETQAAEVLLASEPKAPLKMEDNKKDVLIPKKQDVIAQIIGQSSVEPSIGDLIPGKSTAMSMPERTNITPHKNIVYDVKTRQESIGPIDEIKNFSLIDLRRLSYKPAEAFSRLKQKFINLKDESILQFFSSWEAWRESGLFSSYVQSVDVALASNHKLHTVLGEKEKISIVEIENLINMEKELDI